MSDLLTFRQMALVAVGEVLSESALDPVRGLCEGIVSTIDAIHSYTEEGVRLFPEVLITTAVPEIVESVPFAEFIPVGTVVGIEEGIANAIKRCAPLARDGWIIAIQVGNGEQLSYGLLTAEVTELSPSVYRHVVGDLAVSGSDPPAIYLRGLGGNRVEIRTRSTQRTFAVSLSHQTSDGREIGTLADAVVADLDEEVRSPLRFFFAKVLGDALRHTHGCIVSVASDSADAIGAIKAKYPDGAYLEKPVDLALAVRHSQEREDRHAWMTVRNYVSLLRGMLSHDGITLLSSRGRILGYNIFVPRDETAATIRGGARSRAFHTLSTGGLIICGLAMSQDGGTKLCGGPNG